MVFSPFAKTVVKVLITAGPVCFPFQPLAAMLKSSATDRDAD